MNGFDQLFIRACKSRNPFKRLKTLRKRFYLERDDSDHDLYAWIVEIGMEVVHNTIGFSVDRFRYFSQDNSAVSEMQFNPDKFKDWNFNQRRNYVNAYALRLYFAHTKKDNLLKIGYVSPCRFRQEEKSKWRLTTRYEYVGY